MDASSRTTQFSGVAGRVVREALGPETMFTGIVLAIVFGAVGFMVSKMTPALSVPVMQAMGALALGRFAVNGFHGEWRGSVLSTSGGSWVEVAAVALRYAALNALWLVPLVVLGFRPDAVAGAAQAMLLGTGGGTIVVLAVVYFTAATLVPPACLVVATSAPSFGDAFRPSQWGVCFSGRLGELFLLYAVYLGTVAFVVVGALPVVVVGAVASTGLAMVFGAGALCFAFGLAVTLLGRLAGFFAFGETDDAPAEADPAGPREIASAPSAGFAPPSIEPSAPKKAPLMDGAERAQEAWRRFEQDPAGATAWLEELHEAYAPHPHVLQSLALMKLKAGFVDQATALAKEAVALCLSRGHVAMAAEVYKGFGAQASKLGLDREAVLSIAASLAKSGDVRPSAAAFAGVVVADPHERRAIKGLMSLAEQRLRPDGSAEEAAKIYTFLLERCADSPLCEDMRRGLEASRRRLVRA